MSYFVILPLVVGCLLVRSLANGHDIERQQADQNGRPLIVPIEYNLKSKYHLEMVVGSPPQRLNVTLSSATVNSWLLSSRIGGVAGKLWLAGTPKYCAAKSNTSINTNQYFNDTPNYGLILNGYYMKDRASFNNGSVSMLNLNFGEVDNLTGVYSKRVFPTSGVLSLAVKLDLDQDRFGFIMGLYFQDLISSPIYSLNLNPDPNTSPAGSLILGAIDSSAYRGEIAYVPLLEDSTSFKVTNIHFKLNQWSSFHYNSLEAQSINLFSNYRARLDTTTDMILVTNAREINAGLGATELDNSHTFVFEGCDPTTDRPDLVFTLSSSAFNITLTPEEYMVRSEFDQDLCFSLIQNFPMPDMILLGNAVLRKYYTIYDSSMNRLGFANKAG